MDQNIFAKIKNLLSLGFIYNSFIFFVGKFGLSKLRVFSRYVPYAPGDAILDLGCGPGTNSDLFFPDDYLGIDISEKYINAAKEKHPHHNFICGNFLELDPSFDESFDLIFVSGLLHHINDDLVRDFMEKAYTLLKPGGHLLAIENCLHYKQSKLKKKIILMDRGQHVRSNIELEEIMQRTSFKFTAHIDESLLLMPYSHIIISCKKDIC